MAGRILAMPVWHGRVRVDIGTLSLLPQENRDRARRSPERDRTGMGQLAVATGS